jgi:hypothetical protein
MIPYLLRCQGFAVAYYGFTLDALDLELMSRALILPFVFSLFFDHDAYPYRVVSVGKHEFESYFRRRED